ncbi:hypothetical protein MNBD_CHLOROFLEXI01-5353 [hydrothermal vent metagenome]|uniref:Uncharacterized protein n=1 Tax=hydrothermal vent metagenome TaxID=652676 RepID=A0A3B0VWS1_9ZZZZ
MSKQHATAVSWKNKPMPDVRKELLLNGRYTRAEFVTISQGFVPQGASDKWFIYLQDEWLHCHRSVSGSCIFILQIVPDEDDYAAPILWVNQEPSQYRSFEDEYDVALLAYLIDTILLGRFAPFPQAKQFSETDRQRHQQHVMGQDGGLRLRMANGNQ